MVLSCSYPIVHCAAYGSVVCRRNNGVSTRRHLYGPALKFDRNGSHENILVTTHIVRTTCAPNRRIQELNVERHILFLLVQHPLRMSPFLKQPHPDDKYLTEKEYDENGKLIWDQGGPRYTERAKKARMAVSTISQILLHILITSLEISKALQRICASRADL